MPSLSSSFYLLLQGDILAELISREKDLLSIFPSRRIPKCRVKKQGEGI